MTISMDRISNNWRIGEKIAFGFSLAGLLFLLVIWQYHSTLNKSLLDYQQLIDIYNTKKSMIINIELSLLNARHAEKNFLLKHKIDDTILVSNQIQKALQLTDQIASIKDSSQKMVSLLKKDLTNYLKHFDLVKSAWVKKGLDENSGLQGSFRNAAHALEKMASIMQYDKIHINLLQLRRREKDYLLRGHQQYVDLTLNIIQNIQQQVDADVFFNDNEKLTFKHLLSNYKNDFSALVEQNTHINQRQNEMESAAIDVTKLVNKNVEINNNEMNEMTQYIHNSSAQRVNSLLLIVAITILLSIYFTLNITLRIVKPLKKMAIILEDLAYTEKVEKMPYQQDARDEINSMAGSLNLLAEHRMNFINWWKSAMDASDACSQLQIQLDALVNTSSNIPAEFLEVKKGLMDALSEKKHLLKQEHIKIQQYIEEIIKQSAKLDHVSIPRDDIDKVSKTIIHKAMLIQKSLEMVNY